MKLCKIGTVDLKIVHITGDNSKVQYKSSFLDDKEGKNRAPFQSFSMMFSATSALDCYSIFPITLRESDSRKLLFVYWTNKAIYL